MENISEKYPTNIITNEYQNFQPISILNLNTLNKKTVFKIGVGDNFIGAQYWNSISGKVVKDDEKDLQNDDTVELLDDFSAFLFSEIEVRKHDTMIDQIDNVGVASLVKGTISYSMNGNRPTINPGFQSSYKKKA
ncbi:hypothetical protein JTB14_036483 [Gonioctena quinquepunctata]|nr:hypothetical protein JTB14_036483 [Gonioctena quinquepunctata]